ncbi:hypothetical protein F441_02102, partial [Phytophthora nicotianae CJ01A1]
TRDTVAFITNEDHQASQHYKERICEELLRSQLQQIERLEVNLKRVFKYSNKLMNTHEEIAVILAHEKDAANRLATTVGASTHNVGYVRRMMWHSNSAAAYSWNVHCERQTRWMQKEEVFG